MLTTLLTRTVRAIVRRIDVDCPTDTVLLRGVTPHADGGTLAEALTRTGELGGVDAAPVRPSSPQATEASADADSVDEDVITLHIGCPHRTGSVGGGEATWVVWGAGWTGNLVPAPAVGAQLLPHLPEDGNPIGPYIAACLAAGLVFLTVRMGDYAPTAIRVDGWNMTLDDPTTAGTGARNGAATTTGGSVMPALLVDRGSSVPNVVLDHVVAGVGAVGSAVLQTLWAAPGISGNIVAVDADVDGIDPSNLNRCVPFIDDDIGSPKAPTIETRLNGAPMRRPDAVVIEGHEGRAEEHVGRDTHLISAVDTSQAREALQLRYPRSAVQASTKDLRLEVLRVNPKVSGPCLRCFNEPRRVTDRQLVEAFDIADEQSVAQHAEALGVRPDDVMAWYRNPGCGQIGDGMLARLREARTDDPREFSVGFVSVLAGVLLAGQVIKDQVRRQENAEALVPPPLSGDFTQFRFTLAEPHAVTNGVFPYQRDIRCPCCHPGLKRELWLKRWTG